MSEANGSTALTVTDLHAGYENVEILHGVSIRVDHGAIVSIIGPNGAGKSTLIKSIYGLARVTIGSVHYHPPDDAQREVTHLPPYKLTRMGMNYVPQLDNVFPNLSVEENLEIGLYIQPKQFRERRAYVEELFPILADRRRQRAATLSGGQRQMLGLGRALMTDPSIILLDEPSAGLAPQIVEEVYDKLSEINASGVTMLVVEQNATIALEMSQYAYVLEMGRNRYEGPGPELLRDERIAQLYLGGESPSTGADQSEE